MKIIRIFALILSIITVLAVFAACNSGSGISETADIPAQSAPVNADVQSGSENKATDSYDGFFNQYVDGNASVNVELPVISDIRDGTFKESALAQSAVLPDFNTIGFSISDVDMGDGSYMNIAEGVNSQQFSDYLTSLVDAGFTYYADNKIGRNFFVTFATKTQIVNAMYLWADREVRVVVDDRAKFSLHGLEEDNVYEDLGLNSLTVVAIEETGWPGGMGYILELADGSFLIIDGGYYNGSNIAKSSAEWVFKSLKQLAADPDNITVAAWLITHPHSDHYGAFVAMSQMAEYREGITVEQLIYNNPAEEHITSTGTTEAVSMIETAIDVWEIDTLIKAHPGQQIYVRDARITVYGSADIVVPQDFAITNVNNLNVVTMVDYMGKRSLYLGDSQEVQNPILARLYGSELKTDILQLAHHGYNNTDAGGVYRLADPSIVFWPVSNYHYSGETYSGKVRDLALNQMFFADGIMNYVAGMLNMTITDFETWIPDERWNPKEIVQ